MEKIGKFELVKQIGRGAMGTVYEGFDTRMKRRVAVKLPRMEEFAPHQIPELLARFDHEAEAIGRLSHRHIVTIFEYGEHEGAPYIVIQPRFSSCQHVPSQSCFVHGRRRCAKGVQGRP